MTSLASLVNRATSRGIKTPSSTANFAADSNAFRKELRSAYLASTSSLENGCEEPQDSKRYRVSKGPRCLSPGEPPEEDECPPLLSRHRHEQSTQRHQTRSLAESEERRLRSTNDACDKKLNHKSGPIGIALIPSSASTVINRSRSAMTLLAERLC